MSWAKSVSKLLCKRMKHSYFQTDTKFETLFTKIPSLRRKSHRTALTALTNLRIVGMVFSQYNKFRKSCFSMKIYVCGYLPIAVNMNTAIIYTGCMHIENILAENAYIENIHIENTHAESRKYRSGTDCV